MKQFVRSHWKTILSFVVVGLVGGYFTGLYALDSYPPELQQQLLEQGIDAATLGLVSAVQSAGYGLVLGSIGIFLSKKLGLWKSSFRLEKKPLIAAIVISVIGGLSLILPDLFFFGKFEPVLLQAYESKPTLSYLAATVTYGAVIEEVMLRLFFMSLIAFVLHLIFDRRKERPSVAVLVAANVISALLFAAGHLPMTFMSIGDSAVIILRCFLLNGAFGLLFGWLYRKYGLAYAMIAHGGCHIVSKLIWILFL
ncbi:MAG: CPBP family intramembrane metalloprotease [Ruminococcaceae bacterium]|nr:CPBP family intramembrane metalloprotease [Oscillospiraceae bacterium]